MQGKYINFPIYNHKYLKIVRKLITYCLSIFIVALIACENKTTEPEVKDTPVVPKADTISETRTVVQKAPVASHYQKVPDELNNWKFAVEVYETKNRFNYIVRIQYKEIRITDSISIPNIGIEPSVQIQADNQPFSCTLGFPDKKGNFNPYYRASIKNEQLRFKKIASYGVSVRVKS